MPAELIWAALGSAATGLAYTAGLVRGRDTAAEESSAAHHRFKQACEQARYVPFQGPAGGKATDGPGHGHPDHFCTPSCYRW